MKHHLSDEHPLQPIRVKLAVDLIQSTGLIEHAHLLPPRAATVDELALVHSREYIDLVRKLSDPAQRRHLSPEDVDAAGFASADNPISEELHEGTSLVVGASIVAAETIAGGGALHAFSPSGGLHHAHRDRASGFCTYNDAAVACQWLKDQGYRVAYVDVDVHHGDGVEGIFQSDPDVLTISLHESGHWLFPGTGFPRTPASGRAKGRSPTSPSSHTRGTSRGSSPSRRSCRARRPRSECGLRCGETFAASARSTGWTWPRPSTSSGSACRRGRARSCRRS